MKSKLFQIVCLSLLLGICIKQVSAVPAYPYPVKITQSDGSVITIVLKGDERVKWAESADGYTLLRNSKGVFEFAMLDKYTRRFSTFWYSYKRIKD
jgi:hypothetical protein